MPWCLKNRFGELFEWTVYDTRSEVIDHAISVYRPHDVRPMTRLEGWNWIKREFGLTAVRVETTEVVFEPDSLTDAQRLALVVLRGDTDAALVLADLVLSEYHARSKTS